MEDCAQEEFDAMRERSQHTKDGLIADKMRYRKALLLACGGDEEKARQFVKAAEVGAAASLAGEP